MKISNQKARCWAGLLMILCLSFMQLCILTFCDTAEAKLAGETVYSEEFPLLDKNNPHIKKVIDLQERYHHALMAVPDVVGTAAGLADDNSPTILVFTKKKTMRGAIPEYLEGISVTETVTGEIFALAKTSAIKPTSKFPMPVPIGVSTGNNGECSAGTIGARVKDASGVYALSNNHVYALENDASIGSTILQPGLYDTRCRHGQSNEIGSLWAFVRIDFNGGDNTVDAAIATSSTSQLNNSTPSDGYGKPNCQTYTPYIGQPVKKYGRTTKLTTGTVNGINVTVKVCYNSSCSLIATFVDQIAIGSGGFSKAGDSGSLIVSNDSYVYPIGLLFAGGSGVTFANPIDPVLTLLGVTIDCSNP
jgi:hypothetical protein